MGILATLTGMDTMKMKPGKKTVHYEGKTWGIFPAGVKARTTINNVLTLPPRMPSNVKINEGEKGLVFKQYAVSWDVPKGLRGERKGPLQKLRD